MSRDGPLYIHGLRAARAALEHRIDAVERVLYAPERREELQSLLDKARGLGRECREADPAELSRLARSPRHQGVVVVVAPLPLLDAPDLLARLPRDALLLALDGVENPHNLGAILRSAAWFGATAILLPSTQAKLVPAALRVAQGGAEIVPCAQASDLSLTLRRLAANGVTIVAAETEGGEPAITVSLPRPLCLVMGSEEQGLSPAVRAACTRRVTIPGTGAVESLNVSVAAGVLLAGATKDGPGGPLLPGRSGPPARSRPEREGPPRGRGRGGRRGRR